MSYKKIILASGPKECGKGTLLQSTYLSMSTHGIQLYMTPRARFTCINSYKTSSW